MFTYATMLCHPAPTETPVAMHCLSFRKLHIRSNNNRKNRIPESTGWTLFNKMENESNGDKSATALATSESVVKIYASLSLRNRNTKNSTNPITNDVRTVIRMENFAAFELPLPSSFATRTLQKIISLNLTTLSFRYSSITCNINVFSFLFFSNSYL